MGWESVGATILRSAPSYKPELHFFPQGKICDGLSIAALLAVSWRL